MRFPALRNKAFVIYTAGSVSATNALWINRVIIGWLGWELTGLASWVGFLSFFLFAPTIVSSPLFGVMIDRVDIRRAAIISQSLLLATIVALLVLHMTGSLTIWLLSLIALSVGFTSSADRTIRFVMVPRIVDREALANAVALHGINFNTARLIGPALGGVLIDMAGTGVAILVNLLMILPFLAVLVVVKPRDRDAQETKQRKFFADLIDGARYAVGHPVIRKAMFLSGIFSITTRGVIEILPAIADGQYHRGAQGLGQMLAASGAGALVSAIIIAVRRPGSSEVDISLSAQIAAIGGIASVILLGATANWYFAMAMIFAFGYCMTIIAIDLQTSVQMALDDTYRGRVMSLWIVLVIGGAAMSAIALGFFADVFGMPGTLIGAGVSCAAILLLERLVSSGRRRAPPPST